MYKHGANLAFTILRLHESLYEVIRTRKELATVLDAQDFFDMSWALQEELVPWKTP